MAILGSNWVKARVFIHAADTDPTFCGEHCPFLRRETAGGATCLLFPERKRPRLIMSGGEFLRTPLCLRAFPANREKGKANE